VNSIFALFYFESTKLLTQIKTNHQLIIIVIELLIDNHNT